MKSFFPSLVHSRGSTQLSMGRVLLFMTFMVQLVYWIAPLILKSEVPVTPEGLGPVLNSLLIYEGYKKGRYTVDHYLTAKDDNKREDA